MYRNLAIALAAFAVPAFASAAPSTIAVLELDGTEKIEFANVAKPDVSIPLTVENKGKGTVKKASIDITPFTAPTGESEGATVTPAEADIPAGMTQQFILTANLPSAATFKARARVLAGSQPLLPFTVQVARTKARPGIDIGGVAAVQKTAELGHPSLDIPLKLKLYATEEPAHVPPPVLDSATRKPKADSQSGEAATAELDVTGLSPSIRVEPGTPAEITVPVTNIGSPGRYDLKLRFAAPGFEVIDKDVTVYVRDPALLAFGLIALGVLLSLALQAFGKTIRPRLVAQKRVTTLLGDLRNLESSAADAEAKRLVADVRAAIKARWDASVARRLSLTGQFDVYEEIVPSLRTWVALHERTLRIHPESVRLKLLAKLEQTAAAFRATPPDKAKVNEAITTLSEFPHTIREEIEKELRQQLDALDKELRSDGRPAAARLRNTLQVAKQALDRGQVEAAAGSFQTARLQYAYLLADDLRARVEAKTPPAGMQDADWSTLRGSIVSAVRGVQATADADEAMRLIELAVGDYLRTVGAALRSASDAFSDDAKAKPVHDALDEVEAALDGKKLTAAWQQLQKAQEAYQKAALPVGQPMGAADKSAMEALANAAGSAVGAGAFDIMTIQIDVPPSANELDRPGATIATARSLTRYDILASLVVLIVATLVGLQTLWINDPTWGGWGSYLTAFASGFALDQFTHAGIQALRLR